MKRVIILVLTVLFIVSMVGCENNGENESKLKENVMLSFDSYDELLSVVQIDYPFGKTSFCSDKNYVIEGEKSLRVEPEGEYTTTNTYPTMTIYTDGESFNKGDFSQFDGFAFSIYNANETALEIQVTMNAYNNNNLNLYSPLKVYSLQPNSWNKVEYDFSDNVLKSAMNNLSQVNHIMISFLQYKQAKNDKVNVFYLDNLVSEIKSNKVDTARSNLEEKQLYNFERNIDKSLISVRTYNSLKEIEELEGRVLDMRAWMLPRVSICNDIVFATEGKSSLKVEFPKVRNDRYKSDASYYSFVYFNVDSSLQPEDATLISMDVINDNEFSSEISLTLYDVEGASYSKSYTLAPRSKQTITSSEKVNFAEKELSYIRLDYTNRVETEHTVLYVDNIRFC